MSVPMRKDEPQLEEELTTADLAQGKRPASSEDRPKPVLASRPGETAQNTTSQARADFNDVGSDVRNDDVRDNDLRNEVRRTGAGPAEVRDASDAAPLFPSNELDDLRNRWSAVQTAFVDEPRKAVEQADSLVASAMKRLAEVFAEERSKLEGQWDRGDNVSTEDLRIALQRYRSFFQRLLSI